MADLEIPTRRAFSVRFGNFCPPVHQAETLMEFSIEAEGDSYSSEVNIALLDRVEVRRRRFPLRGDEIHDVQDLSLLCRFIEMNPLWELTIPYFGQSGKHDGEYSLELRAAESAFGFTFDFNLGTPFKEPNTNHLTVFCSAEQDQAELWLDLFIQRDELKRFAAELEQTYSWLTNVGDLFYKS